MDLARVPSSPLPATTPESQADNQATLQALRGQLITDEIAGVPTEYTALRSTAHMEDRDTATRPGMLSDPHLASTKADHRIPDDAPAQPGTIVHEIVATAAAQEADQDPLPTDDICRHDVPNIPVPTNIITEEQWVHYVVGLARARAVAELEEAIGRPLAVGSEEYGECIEEVDVPLELFLLNNANQGFPHAKLAKRAGVDVVAKD